MTLLSNLDHHLDSLLANCCDERGFRPHVVSSMAPRSWPLPLNLGNGNPWESRDPSSRQRINSGQTSCSSHYNSSPITMLSDWSLPQNLPSPPTIQQRQQGQQEEHQQHPQTSPQSISQLSQFLPSNPVGGQFSPYSESYQQQAQLDYTTIPSTQPPYEPKLVEEDIYNNPNNSPESQKLRSNWEEFQNQITFAGHDALPTLGSRQSFGSNSPKSTYLEVTSLPSAGSNNGWAMVNQYSNLDTSFHHHPAIFNSSQTLHLRTDSDSSASDSTYHYFDSCATASSNFEKMPYPYSPISESYLNLSKNSQYSHSDPLNTHPHTDSSLDNLSSPVPILPVSIPISPQRRLTPPLSASSSPSYRLTPGSSSSPPGRRHSASQISPSSKISKPTVRRASIAKPQNNTGKRVGRRRGPLLPEQRKQASEIRKLRACLRCKFLKKTCDKGEPCAGCQPSHARLWQVPCTRIDIKDIAYFMKDWRADHERLMGQGISVYNIQGFAQKEHLIWITHGYGFAIPIMAQEVFVTDESCLTVGWVESIHKQPLGFDTRTERITAGSNGISTEALSEYLDKHLEGPFEIFLDEHFEGTPFITDILKTAHRYYVKEQVPVIRKALKLVLAYNLTLHVTLVEQYGGDSQMEGLVINESSKYNGKTMAPALINFQIRCALADMWRDLQKEVLVELSSLYSSVYSGDRLKNWPTIFMLASILLAVWEEMQFDSHYRVPDPIAVHKFCNDMETTPVGVIVGLFHAISQKLPSFTEWDTRRHGQLLNNNLAVCEAMTEMKFHVTKHENYLRTRPGAQFDSRNFDSLSNKFLSKLVIRAN